jgi:hypothetical protein
MFNLTKRYLIEEEIIEQIKYYFEENICFCIWKTKIYLD